MRLTYAIKYVADMDRAIAFHRDTLGLELKFESPFWSEFATGETTLALHPASPDHPAGGVELGFAIDNLGEFYARREELGLSFVSAVPDRTDGVDHPARAKVATARRLRIAGFAASNDLVGKSDAEVREARRLVSGGEHVREARHVLGLAVVVARSIEPERVSPIVEREARAGRVAADAPIEVPTVLGRHPQFLRKLALADVIRHCVAQIAKHGFEWCLKK